LSSVPAGDVLEFGTAVGVGDSALREREALAINVSASVGTSEWRKSNSGGVRRMLERNGYFRKASAAGFSCAVLTRPARKWYYSAGHPELCMSDMGTFRVEVEIENPASPGPRVAVHDVLVDTGAELSWFPASILDSLGVQRRKVLHFRQADGTIVTRWTGPAFIYAVDTTATDDVVFGEPRDLVLLGARSLEGLNLRIDPIRKILIDAGPVPSALVVR
jgi:predicted aspartyl protease